MKKKTVTRQVGDDKSKRKEIKSETTPWTLKQKQKGNEKINDRKNKSLYNWIIHHPQVVQLQIINDGLKLNIDVKTEPQFVPKLLLQVSVRELHNSLISDTSDGGIKEARDTENNIVIRDSTLHSLFTSQLKKCHQDTKFI